MLVNDELVAYLTDQKFSNGHKFLFKETFLSLSSRLELLAKLAKNKNIIHLGACDHIPVIEKKNSRKSVVT